MNENLFGTDGIRALVGTGIFRTEQLATLGRAIAYWAQQKYGSYPRILIGHDTRESCSWVKATLKSGLLTAPVHIFDGEVLPTPTVVQLLQKSTLFDVGIIISASHNPYQDNGIKLIEARQAKLSLHDELIISKLMRELPAYSSYQGFGTESAMPQVAAQYMQHLYSFFARPFLHGIKVVLDCSNGAAYQIAPAIFNQLGAEVITLHASPSGRNINENCGALYPEYLQQAVIAHGAHIGFAFDGDADRVMCVTASGLIKNGDDILSILLTHPAYSAMPTVVGTVMTNYGLEAHLARQGRILRRTRVGDKYVSADLIEQGLLLGGEPSGHIIIRDYLDSGDGIFAALRLLETVLITHNWSLESFVQLPQAHINVPVPHQYDLKKPPFDAILATYQKKVINGRLIVRYSGTENVLRIMIEEQEYNLARELAYELSDKLLLAFKTIS
jgi:phosphoglucosamine mutase